MPQIQYFLGANSPSGFYSLYDHLLPPEEARAVYILKGGPGCGKSTLMRQTAARLAEAGFTAEYILCSGDPDSLDGVVFPALGAAIADGTAPHVIEPKLPGAVERYVDLGRCYDTGALYQRRADIKACMAGCQSCYRRAYHLLSAAAEIFEDQRAALVTEGLSHKLARRARGILDREFPRRKGAEAGRVKQRFLGAVSHRGPLTLYSTALAQCGKIYELADRYGLAHELLVHLLAGAVARGYDPVACPDPMAPDRLAHLLVPELGLAFLSTEREGMLPEKPFRRLRLDAAADGEVLRHSRPRLRFAKKVSLALMDEAVASLAQAKATHDDLEAIYNPHVDFELVGRMARAVGDEILSF